MPRPTLALRTLVLCGVVLALAACRSTEPAAEAPSETETAAPPSAEAAPHAIIPVPASVNLAPEGAFVVTEHTQVVVDAGDAEAARIGRYLAEIVGDGVETRPAVVEAGAEGEGPHIRLTRQSAGAGGEGYELVVRPEGATLTAETPAGLFYGVQTMRHLLPPSVEYEAAFPRRLWMPAGRITDAPRFAWRGAMLDVARHFLTVEEVKRYIDLMALYKLNRLHLHLSDDQGWRVEVPGRPRLTEHGGSTEVGGTPGGFYTVEAYAELVAYAQERFVTVVPEIDMPGHTNAALASYPELTCDGQEPELFTGTEVGFSYLCVEKEESYVFVDEVVSAIAAMTPGPYFHLGGDEVHELSEAQYVRFMERAQEIVASHGKRVVGWDEIAEVDLELVPEAVVQVWRPQTPATSQAVADAVAQGASVILSPADRIYLDMKYDSTTVLGLAWAGFNNVRDAYDWEPAAMIDGVGEGAILGIEAPLWSETITTMAEFEYMAFPRLAGAAELAWSRAARRSWDEYRLRLGAQAPRWTALGVNFYRAPGIPWQETLR